MKSLLLTFCLLLSLNACSGSNFEDINNPTPAVENIKWILDNANGKAYLRFDAASKTIQASAGCNGLGGAYTLNGTSLTTEEFASTQLWCEGVMEWERKLGNVISKANKVFVHGNKLTLLDGTTILATFTAD